MANSKRTKVRFRLHADAEFEADSIDDAFQALADHFQGLAESSDSQSIIDAGFIEVKPIE